MVLPTSFLGIPGHKRWSNFTTLIPGHCCPSMLPVAKISLLSVYLIASLNIYSSLPDHDDPLRVCPTAILARGALLTKSLKIYSHNTSTLANTTQLFRLLNANLRQYDREAAVLPSTTIFPFLLCSVRVPINIRLTITLLIPTHIVYESPLFFKSKVQGTQQTHYYLCITELAASHCFNVTNKWSNTLRPDSCITSSPNTSFPCPSHPLIGIILCYIFLSLLFSHYTDHFTYFTCVCYTSISLCFTC